jgi:hypothetical protein
MRHSTRSAAFDTALLVIEAVIVALVVAKILNALHVLSQVY